MRAFLGLLGDPNPRVDTLMTIAADQCQPVRVVIVDDSTVVRNLIRSWLEAEPDLVVVGEAADGAEAVQQVLRLRPDVVTMDLEMPVMNGLQAIEAIMGTQAVPILVLSSSEDAEQSCQALNLGAVEVMAKPALGSAQARHLVERVRLLAGVSVITRRRIGAMTHSAGARRPASELPASTLPVSKWSASELPASTLDGPSKPGSVASVPARVVAIAASTGGPQALACILAKLPGHFPCTVLVAQHIVDGFAAGMVDWLAGLCRLPVHLAKDGDWALPGQVYVSPSEQNLKLSFNRRLALQPPDQGSIYHPSCNLLLESVAQCCGRQAVGLILSGMGNDGARGIAAIRAAGGVTMAQDETTSVVFGMNRVAIEAGEVHHILPAERIAEALCRLAEASVAFESPAGFSA